MRLDLERESRLLVRFVLVAKACVLRFSREGERRGPSGKLLLLDKMVVRGKCTIIPVVSVVDWRSSWVLRWLQVRVDTWLDVVERVTIVGHQEATTFFTVELDFSWVDLVSRHKEFVIANLHSDLVCVVPGGVQLGLVIWVKVIVLVILQVFMSIYTS